MSESSGGGCLSVIGGLLLILYGYTDGSPVAMLIGVLLILEA